MDYVAVFTNAVSFGLLCYIVSGPYSLFAPSHSWLNCCNQRLSYNYKQQSKTRGGGTMMKLGGNVNLIEQLHTNLPESVAVLAEAFGNKLIKIVAYVPPRYDKKQFVNELDKELEILSIKIPVVLTGEFNINVRTKNRLQ